MKGKRNLKRGTQRVHAISVYNDTWKKFEDFKHRFGFTVDQSLNYMIDNYVDDNVNKQKDLINILIKKLVAKRDSL